jgi:hypothetical protein
MNRLRRSIVIRVFIGFAGLALAIALNGCGALGAAADAMPKPPVRAQYVLAGQPVAVMVWCDRGVALDWPNLQRDLAGGVVARLKQAIDANNEPLEGTTFPVSVESVIKWQKDYPSLEALPVAESATRLKVPRVIYIELDRLSTRASETIVLYRGMASASVKVVEVVDGKGKVAWERRDIIATYPDKVGEDGTPSGNDYQFYVGTVQKLADQIAKLFVQHAADEA